MLPQAAQAPVIPYSVCGLRLPAAFTLFAVQVDLSFDRCHLQRGESCLQRRTRTAFSLTKHNVIQDCSTSQVTEGAMPSEIWQ